MVMGSILKLLKGFHHHSARQIVGIKAQHTTSRYRECHSEYDSLETAGSCPTKEHINQRY